ncbi:helicase-associated domain-containing protein [Alicyclobacillus cycloheptanicus]|uniref:Helicase XPB/Ssl2 N-terminal domain-containing protein n=1 Tax=Alicyclobacillus cycloheptanicus TaxID=1457 RepID=A0ABT9XEP7_9BACL|nr:helicase-associated domain-containing protein [Alicyclobacillus cycloheptanicus]MDQ0188554.1 hypothetical protein [Alicyclobacillus cycloheptanicus]WDM01238.1 helicase-associated domain-containing protein [Alicyclobacillus cycloheptanicus]
MNLSECLNTADISTLRRIAERYDFSCSKYSKMALIQEILFSFRNKEFLAEHIQEWREGRERVMLRLCLDSRNVFSTEDLSGALSAAGCPEGTLDMALSEGWLYPTTRYAGRLMYCMPKELQAALRRAMIAEFASRLETSEEGPLTYQEEDYALSRDLDVFLEYVLHHDVRLTVDGSLYKRNLTQILELLEVPEEPLQGGWRFGYGRRFHDYPDRFALLYDYAYHNRLIDELEEGTLVVTPEADRWRNMSRTERQRALVRFYITLYRRPITRLPQIVQLVAHVSTAWVRSDVMLSALDAFVNDYYYDSKEQVWSTRILKMLTHLGVIRLGKDEHSVEWFQITKLGQQLLTPEALPEAEDGDTDRRRILIVQPNFEIVATADQPFVTSELALFTELRQTGAVRVYRITEERVQKGLMAGRSVMAWLDFVQNHAQTPVPGNVERTLQEWERQHTAASDIQHQDGPAAGS